MIPRERLMGQNRGGKNIFPVFPLARPSSLSFQVVFMMAAATNVPVGCTFVNRLGELQSFR